MNKSVFLFSPIIVHLCDCDGVPFSLIKKNNCCAHSLRFVSFIVENNHVLKIWIWVNGY